MNDNLVEAERLVEHATATNPKDPTVRMWNTLLRNYAFRADTKSLIRIQDRMLEMGVQPDSMTYAAMMAALVELRRTDDAAKLLRSLHLSRNLSATAFHYSLVLHGFVKEGKRDMAIMIYHEILERFPVLSSSVRLSMLRLQAERDIKSSATGTSAPDWTSRATTAHAWETLSKNLLLRLPAESSSKAPQPGLGRRKVPDSMASIGTEFMIGLCNSHGRYRDAKRLLEQYQSMLNNKQGAGSRSRRYFEFLRLSLETYAGSGLWYEVDRSWKDLVWFTWSESKSMASDVQKECDSGRMKHFVGDSTSSPTQTGQWILFSQRYILSRSLSIYMYALSRQNRTFELEDQLALMQKQGFVLSRKNWNTYVRILAMSTNPKDQLSALLTFERELLPHAKEWGVLRSGRSVDDVEPSEQDGTLRFVQRDRSGKLPSPLMVPDYDTITTVRALARGLRVELMNRESLLYERLKRVAPLALEWLHHLPDYGIDEFLKSRSEKKAQSLLHPDPPDAFDRAGVQGSQSPLKDVPIDHLSELYDYVRTIQQDPSPGGTFLSRTDHRSSHDTDRALELAEKIDGSITRSAIWVPEKSRHETDQERDGRVASEVTQKLAFFDRLVQAMYEEVMSANEQAGDPYIDPLGSLADDATAALQLTETVSPSIEIEQEIYQKDMNQSDDDMLKLVYELLGDDQRTDRPVHEETGFYHRNFRPEEVRIRQRKGRSGMVFRFTKALVKHKPKLSREKYSLPSVTGARNDGQTKSKTSRKESSLKGKVTSAKGDSGEQPFAFWEAGESGWVSPYAKKTK